MSFRSERALPATEPVSRSSPPLHLRLQRALLPPLHGAIAATRSTPSRSTQGRRRSSSGPSRSGRGSARERQERRRPSLQSLRCGLAPSSVGQGRRRSSSGPSLCLFGGLALLHSLRSGRFRFPYTQGTVVVPPRVPWSRVASPAPAPSPIARFARTPSYARQGQPKS